MGKTLYIAGGVAVIVVILVIVVPTAVLVPRKNASFKAKFNKKCRDFGERNDRCEQLFKTFEMAYVGKDPCNFPMNNYDQLFRENPFKHSCSKTMFWSGTKGAVHKFTKKSENFFTLEDTLLGYIMNDLEWCGKEGSQETFMDCTGCKEDTKNSFWKKASAEFASYACKKTSVMLDGKREKPFNPNSNFGSIEVRKLRYPKVTNLKVFLITKNNKVDCSEESLSRLKNLLDPKIVYNCKEVTESHLQYCSSKNQTEACLNRGQRVLGCSHFIILLLYILKLTVL